MALECVCVYIYIACFVFLQCPDVLFLSSFLQFEASLLLNLIVILEVSKVTIQFFLLYCSTYYFFFKRIRKCAVCDATFIHIFLFSTYAALILHVLVPPGVLGHLSLLIKGGRFTLGAILNKWCPVIIISMSEIYLSTSQFDNFITSKANTFVKMHVLFHRAVCPPLVKAIKLL